MPPAIRRTALARAALAAAVAAMVAAKAEYGRIRCPTLVLGGEDDPMHPIESQADIAAALPPHLVQFERFADCGHGVVPDAPERAITMIRRFITGPK